MLEPLPPPDYTTSPPLPPLAWMEFLLHHHPPGTIDPEWVLVYFHRHHTSTSITSTTMTNNQQYLLQNLQQRCPGVSHHQNQLQLFHQKQQPLCGLVRMKSEAITPIPDPPFLPPLASGTPPPGVSSIGLLVDHHTSTTTTTISCKVAVNLRGRLHHHLRTDSKSMHLIGA